MEKLCSFYISDWHLVTMILPYINKEINEAANIITILENNLESNIEILTSKLNLKNKQKILEIDWNKTSEKEKIEVLTKLKKLSSQTENIIFVKGNKNYIEKINELMKREIKNNKEKYKNINIKIINCYEVTDFNGNILDILNSHDRILNTAGEKEISDVFEGYNKGITNNAVNQ